MTLWFHSSSFVFFSKKVRKIKSCETQTYWMFAVHLKFWKHPSIFMTFFNRNTCKLWHICLPRKHENFKLVSIWWVKYHYIEMHRSSNIKFQESASSLSMTHQKLSTSEAEKLVFLQDSYSCALLGNQSQKHKLTLWSLMSIWV